MNDSLLQRMFDEFMVETMNVAKGSGGNGFSPTVCLLVDRRGAPPVRTVNVLSRDSSDVGVLSKQEVYSLVGGLIRSMIKQAGAISGCMVIVAIEATVGFDGRQHTAICFWGRDNRGVMREACVLLRDSDGHFLPKSRMLVKGIAESTWPFERF